MQSQHRTNGVEAIERWRAGSSYCRAITLSVLLAPAAGFGGSWEYVPTISTGVGYETNPRWVSDSQLEDDAYTGFLDGAVDVAWETERSRVSTTPRAAISGYTGTVRSSNLNHDDYYLPVSGQWVDPRLKYGFDAGYSHISTVNSEIRVADPNNPGQPGSSGRIVSIGEYQDRYYAAPFVNFQMTPRDLIGATLSYDDVSYDQAALTNRSNYQYASTSVSWTRTLGLRTQISGSVNLNGFRATQPGNPVKNETVSYGFDIGYQYALTDLTSVGLTAGSSKSDITLTGLTLVDADNNPATPPLPCFDPGLGQFVPCEVRSSDKNFVGRLFLTRKIDQTISTEFSVSRSITPSSDGAQVTQDSARAFISKNFAQRWTGSAGVTYIRQEAVGARTGGTLTQRFNRNYLRGEASLYWRLSRTWALGGAYSYSSDEQARGSNYSTVNQIVRLQITYRGLGTH